AGEHRILEHFCFVHANLYLLWQRGRTNRHDAVLHCLSAKQAPGLIHQGGSKMQIAKQQSTPGNVLLCVLCTILIVSIIGGNVLLNCVTRYNAASTQVRSWKESLDAAETGGDVAYAEVRKTILDPTHAFSGWTYSGGAYSNSPLTYGADSLTTNSKVDLFY